MGVLKNTFVNFKQFGSDSTVDFSLLNKKITVNKLKPHFSKMQKIVKSDETKSNRQKIKQDIIVSLVNELYGYDRNVANFDQLKILLDTSSKLRSFVKDVRNAITGMTTMMEAYVDSGITFDSWQAIIDGRDKLKAHNKDKAAKIKVAAAAFKQVQLDILAVETNILATLSMESKIDLLTKNELDQSVKHDLSEMTGTSEALAKATAAAIDKLRATELAKYQINKGSYKLPVPK